MDLRFRFSAFGYFWFWGGGDHIPSASGRGGQFGEGDRGLRLGVHPAKKHQRLLWGVPVCGGWGPGKGKSPVESVLLRRHMKIKKRRRPSERFQIVCGSLKCFGDS